MNEGIMYAIMRIDEDSDDGRYLCHDDGFYWAVSAPHSHVVHITALHFGVLARWYWETFRGETPLDTWARRYKVSYNQRLQTISYGIDDMVFCGCRLYQSPTLKSSTLKVYEPKYNHVIGDREIYEWVKKMGNIL